MPISIRPLPHKPVSTAVAVAKIAISSSRCRVGVPDPSRTVECWVLYGVYVAALTEDTVEICD